MKKEKKLVQSCRKNLKRKISYDKVSGEYSFDCLTENDEIKKFITPVSICWMIENACNLNCVYCFAEHKNLNNLVNDYKVTVNHILSLNPITIVLTGGEPTLNRNIKDILKYIGNNAITIVDSNGTYMSFEELVPYLKNSVVRFSIDSLDTKIIEKVRPSKKLSDTAKQISRIEKNIQILTSNNIPVIIQTVMTKYNIGELANIHDFLIRNGVKRWYISAVKYSEKCKNNYDSIGLSANETLTINQLIENFHDINVTFSIENDAGARARLFVEKSGKFFVDTIVDGIEYVGQNPYCPMPEEVYDKLDCEKHYDLYIKKKNLMRNKRS